MAGVIDRVIAALRGDEDDEGLRKYVKYIDERLIAVERQQVALQERVEQMAVEQDQVNAQFDDLKASFTDLEADVAKLLANSQVGQPMSQENFDTLKSLAARAKALAGVYDSTGGTTEPPTPEV